MQEHYQDDELTSLDISRELERHFVFDYGQEVRDLFDELPWQVANHLHLNYGKLMGQGFGGIKEDIEAGLKNSTGDPIKQEFYRAAGIAIEAAVSFINRYSRKTEAESRKPENSPQRAVELKAISDRLGKIALNRPKNFQEGMQLLWMAHLIANIGGGSALSFARFDQYMYPLYEMSIKEGSIDRDEAAHLISCMWLKVNEPKMRTVQSLTLGGTDPEGNDVSNELTRICLEVCAELKQPFPNTSLRVHKGTPVDLYELAIKSIRSGSGNPMLMNDDAWLPNLMKRGITRTEASEYFNMGCVEIMIAGKQAVYGGIPGVLFPQILNRVLETHDQAPFQSFEALLQVYLEEIKSTINAGKVQAKEYYRAAADRYFDPYASCLIDDCLCKGLDMYQGGAALPGTFAVGGSGLGTAVDSLSAIKTFVFDEQRLSLAELNEMIKTDFRGKETVRRMLNSRTPCFGNDLTEVDDIAVKVLQTYTSTVQALNDDWSGGPFISSLFSYTSHLYQGELLGATPNGRRSGEAISDNAGPSQGKDTGGPTRLLNSIAKLKLSEVTGAYAMNLKIDPRLLASTAGSTAFKNLIQTHFDQGGLQLQINCVDQEMLRDAQAHPEQHRGLIVRVAGFSEYFAKLDKALQDEIISRMIHAT